MSDIPPGQRCVMADCEAPPVDPDHPNPLCPEHHPGYAGDGDTEATAGQDASDERDQDGAEHVLEDGSASHAARGGDTGPARDDSETTVNRPPEGGSPAPEPGGNDDTNGSSDDEHTQPRPSGGPSYRELYERAADRADRETWEYIEHEHLQAVMDAAGFGHLMAFDDGLPVLAQTDWLFADFSDDGDDVALRWYYPSGDEPRPAEFRRFHQLLTSDTPDGYEPHYFRVAPASKAPATEFGSWKSPDARLSAEEAVDWMEQGGNVGLGGRGGCRGCGGRASPYCPQCDGEGHDDSLVNIDIDDDEETAPDDLPATLRARSRSRGGWHGWAFKTGDRAIPNIPTDEAGEVRTDWQYVVAPGSFVASAREEIADGWLDDSPGYYTVENADPVARIEYDDLPAVFRDRAESLAEQRRDAGPDPATTGGESDTDATGRPAPDDDGEDRQRSGVFDLGADELVSATDETDRFGSIFHDSSTGANTSVSGELVHCWRHNVAHGGLQACAVLSDVPQLSGYGCADLGDGHRGSGVGGCQLKGDWRLVWGAWHYAKTEGVLPDDDPIPYRVLAHLAADDGVVEGGLVLRDAETGDIVADPDDHDGDTYRALPSRQAFHAAVAHVREAYGVDPGRDPSDPPGTDPDRLVVLPDPDVLTPTETPAADHGPDGEGEGKGMDPGARDDLPSFGDLTQRDAQEQTQAAVAAAVGQADDVLIEALPTMGKTHAAGRAPTLADGDTPVTVVTQRGRNEQYAELRQHAADAGLDVGTKGEPDGEVLILPSLFTDCQTANGDAGEEWAETVREWYDAGATPKQIHVHGGREAGDENDNLPCQREGCDYARKWDFDPSEFALIIGHPTHLMKPKVAADRTVIIDEYPAGAFEETLGGPRLRGAITRYLQEFDALPFDSFADLVHGRRDDRAADVLAWLEDRGVEPDGLGAIRFDDAHKHALAPLAIYTLLETAGGGSLGNGFERTDLPDGGVGVFEYEHGPDDEPAVHLLRRPRAITYATNIIGLDGTPTPDLWRAATGVDLAHEQILRGRRPEYIEHVLQFRIVETTEFSKPYNNLGNVNSARDGALLQGIEQHHDETPAVISSSRAFVQWDRDDIIDLDKNGDQWTAEAGPVDGIMRYGNVLGSNRFTARRVGAVIGSNHYGDGAVGRWAAYAGHAATLGDDARTSDGWGTDLDYGPFGNKVLQHMENDTLQAVLRFGRDADGATVYVETDTLPDWVPVHGRGDVQTLSEGLAETVTALKELGTATTADIADHEAVEIVARRVRGHLSTLQDLGAVTTRPDPEDRRRDLHELTDDSAVTALGVARLPDTEAGDDAGEAQGESCGQILYSNTREKVSAKSPPPPTTPPDGAEGDPSPVADGGVHVSVDIEGGYTAEAEFSFDVTLAEVYAPHTDDEGRAWVLTAEDRATGDAPSWRRRGRTAATRRRRRPGGLDTRGGRRRRHRSSTGPAD